MAGDNPPSGPPPRRGRHVTRDELETFLRELEGDDREAQEMAITMVTHDRGEAR